MDFVTKVLIKLGILKEEFDYHFVRFSLVPGPLLGKDSVSP